MALPALIHYDPIMSKPRAEIATLTQTPQAVGDLLRLDLQLCFALYASGNLMSRLYRPLLDPLGLTYPQYLAMMALWETSPQTMGALGERLYLDSGTLTPLFKRLEQAGLVARERDSEDQRRVLIALTAAGEDLKAKAADIPWTVLCQLPFSPDEAVGLKATLTRLAKGLSESAGDDLSE